MNITEYTIRALETEAKPETLNVAHVALDATLQLGIAFAEVMNRVKRAVFYGKPLEKDQLMMALAGVHQISDSLMHFVHSDLFQNDEALDKSLTFHTDGYREGLNLNAVNARLLHGVIGRMSEGGERLEVLQKQLRTGSAIDLIHYAEELGDDEWYGAIEKDELSKLALIHSPAGEVAFDVSEGAIRARNIAKLEKRNKGRAFNADATVNRDTAAEREILATGDTAHLLASPANAEHLQKSIAQLQAGAVSERELLRGDATSKPEIPLDTPAVPLV